MTLVGVDLREQDVRRREGLAMTDQRPSGEREWEITTNTYIFAGVGAVIWGRPRLSKPWRRSERNRCSRRGWTGRRRLGSLF